MRFRLHLASQFKVVSCVRHWASPLALRRGHSPCALPLALALNRASFTSTLPLALALRGRWHPMFALLLSPNSLARHVSRFHSRSHCLTDSACDGDCDKVFHLRLQLSFAAFICHGTSSLALTPTSWHLRGFASGALTHKFRDMRFVSCPLLTLHAMCTSLFAFQV